MSHPTPEPDMDRESATLLSYLNAPRAHVLGILEGLDEDALRRHTRLHDHGR